MKNLSDLLEFGETTRKLVSLLEIGETTGKFGESSVLGNFMKGETTGTVT